jgi:hypothetical protein
LRNPGDLIFRGLFERQDFLVRVSTDGRPIVVYLVRFVVPPKHKGGQTLINALIGKALPCASLGPDPLEVVPQEGIRNQKGKEGHWKPMPFVSDNHEKHPKSSDSWQPKL